MRTEKLQFNVVVYLKERRDMNKKTTTENNNAAKI